ncbi:hypothetical protein [Bacillus sp. Cr_A10]|uniref:hypothetical protein n=1 Tax=Bacillus sp. Cr_A10 TaxID=3033993 RepID=UPI0023D9CDDB|nr:hypothetical protein [Bacillus sp. Cr_A10]MDF2065088.1 hypothetical protein [Bacillus sp. Cr_A10]
MNWETILTATVIAAVVSGIMNFLIQLYFEHRRVKDRKLQEIKENDKLILHELYTPIYKILSEHITPGDGYEGIDIGQLNRIRKIIEVKPELVDKELDRITYGYLEDLNHLGKSDSLPTDNEKFADRDNKLHNHVWEVYNQKRKNLNLPYEGSVSS